MRLLIVEDATRLRGVLHTTLTKLGHAVDAAADGHEGATLLIDHSYDVVVLDILLPGVDGMTLLERLRARGGTTPVLMLTARDGIDDRVRGLQCGADDYLVKPFDLSELSARIGSVARRYSGNPNPGITLGPLQIDLAARSILRDGRQVALTGREWALFEALLSRPRQMFPKAQLEEKLYAFDKEVESNAIEVHVSRLRKKLGAWIIVTERGQGYRLGQA